MGHADRAKIDIRRFLGTCKTCGAEKGFLHLHGQDSPVRVPCRCESARCPHCARPLLIAPVPHVADDLGGVSWENGLLRLRCASCGTLFASYDREA